VHTTVVENQGGLTGHHHESDAAAILSRLAGMCLNAMAELLEKIE